MGDVVINGMVDGRIYKFQSIEKSEPDLRSAVHRSLISCEIGEWAGGKISTHPVFVVDIRSRYGTDGGAGHCSEIAGAVKKLLADGFGVGENAVFVSDIRGVVKFEKALVAYRCRLEIFCRLKATWPLTFTPTLTTSLPSPQPPGLEIELVCAAPDAEVSELLYRYEFLYRFLHQPPGAAYWKDLSGWQSRNWIVWRPTLVESGTNGLKVLVIEGKDAERGGYDATATISYTIAP